MRRPFRGRQSLRQKLEAHNRADAFYAAAADVEPRGQVFIPPKRAYTKSSGEDTEAPVLRAVGDLLAAHPQVLLAVRQNSGSMQYQGDGGRLIPVWFYRLVRTPSELTFTDYWGFLRDARPFAIECKRPSWKEPRTEREIKQRAFIQMIEALGGVGGFVRGADEAAAVLP